MTPAALAKLHAAAFTRPRPWSAEEFSALADDPSVVILAADRAFMVLRSAGPEAEILTLAVAPDARRQGIARALLALGETQARARGVAEMFLEVAQDNHPALALYRGTGYREAGVRKDYYQGPRGARVSALVLKKAL